MRRRIAAWKREAIFLGAGLLIGAAAAAGIAFALTSEDEQASVRRATTGKATVRVIPPPQNAVGRAAPNSTACRIGGKCENFSWGETADIATSYGTTQAAIIGVWGHGTDSLNLLASIFGLIPQVQAAAAAYVASRYCITLRFPDRRNPFFITASPYGPHNSGSC
jgi:hypothetical protein